MLPVTIPPYLSNDVFLRTPDSHSAHSSTPDSNPTIIFFIPGNPGLLGYYHEFLSLLSASPLSSSSSLLSPGSDPTVLFAGFSLGGFSDPTGTGPRSEHVETLQYPPGAPPGPLYSLSAQIELTHRRLEALVAALQGESASARASGSGPGACRVQVILVGHSVGAYIALEVLRRAHEQHHSQVGTAYAIVGAVLLTPTVVDIARSRHGRIVAPLLAWAPFLDGIVQGAVWGVVRMLPGRALEGFVQWVTGMKGEKLQTTLRWLRSAMMVKQTIFMGGQEMREIGADTWGEEFWGVAGGIEAERESEGWTAPRLVLYFAMKDHWIDDATRDEICKTRGQRNEQQTDGKLWPRIEIDESGKLVHGWCIEQSKEVAEKVCALIQEILER